MTAPAERRIPLNRERVLEVAMAFVDEYGIESLSMRKLGQALGVEAMSLYNHVANKDDILDGIVDLVYAEIELPAAGGDWEGEVRKFAVSAHDALIRHPWAPRGMMRGRPRPIRMQYMESLCCCLRLAGFSSDATYLAYHAIDSHILGFTLWQQGHSMVRERIPDMAAKVLRELPLEEFPFMAEHVRQHLTDGSHHDVSTFDFTLGLILDGLKRMRGAPGHVPAR